MAKKKKDYRAVVHDVATKLQFLKLKVRRYRVQWHIYDAWEEDGNYMVSVVHLGKAYRVSLPKQDWETLVTHTHLRHSVRVSCPGCGIYIGEEIRDRANRVMSRPDVKCC